MPTTIAVSTPACASMATVMPHPPCSWGGFASALRTDDHAVDDIDNGERIGVAEVRGARGVDPAGAVWWVLRSLLGCSWAFLSGWVVLVGQWFTGCR